MTTDVKFAQVNALKISDTMCHDLIKPSYLANFFATALGERKGRNNFNRYEYVLDKIYPVVYQHLTADISLDEETLVESAKLLIPNLSYVIGRTCEDVAEQLVNTPEWEALYATIVPLPEFKKIPWDRHNTELYDDAVVVLAQLVLVHCSKDLQNAPVNDWYSTFNQKSFGLNSETPEASNSVFQKAGVFKTNVNNTSLMTAAMAMWEQCFLNQLAHSLQSSRNLVARHSAWPTSVAVASAPEPEMTTREPTSAVKMNRS